MICPVCQSGVPYPPCRSSYCEGYQDAKNEAAEPCATCWAAGHEAGLEAGRLAAIRDEVMWATRDMEDEAHSRSERHPDDTAAGHAECAAWERLADCCRWLEVTR